MGRGDGDSGEEGVDGGRGKMVGVGAGAGEVARLATRIAGRGRPSEWGHGVVCGRGWESWGLRHRPQGPGGLGGSVGCGSGRGWGGSRW